MCWQAGFGTYYAAGRLIYNVRVAGEWSDHLLTDAIPPFKSMFYSSNKLKASRTKKEIYQSLPNGLPICLKVYVFVHVLASFNLKSKHSALSIIQRSGLVHQSSVQISTYWACTLHRVVFSPTSWAAEPKRTVQGDLEEPSFIICVLLAQTLTLLWPNLVLCHSAPKRGNHARGNSRFGAVVFSTSLS